MPRRPRIVLVHQRHYLPWLFEAADRVGFDVVLVPWRDAHPRAVDLPACVVSCLFLDTDGDPAGAVRALTDLHRREGFDGILACSELAVPLVSTVARSLGLPGLAESTALVVRDKRLMRARLCAAGLRSPDFVELRGPDQWPRAARLRMPVVVKPATGYSSFGVVRVDDLTELAAAVGTVWELCRGELDYGHRPDDTQALLVEEYVAGPEISVESLVYQGEVRVCAISAKGDLPGPYFEEVRFRAPAPLPVDVRAAVTREVVAAHAAFGVDVGVTHTELRLREETEPFVLEMGARVGGGGFLHHLARVGAGVDLAGDALRIAAGVRPLCWDGDPVCRTHAAAYQVPLRGSGRIRTVHGLAGLDDDCRVDRILRLMGPGDLVRAYPAPLTAHPVIVLSRHDSDAEATAFHEELDKTVWIEYEP